jgi:hypothetical protein
MHTTSCAFPRAFKCFVLITVDLAMLSFQWFSNPRYRRRIVSSGVGGQGENRKIF